MKLNLSRELKLFRIQLKFWQIEIPSNEIEIEVLSLKIEIMSLKTKILSLKVEILSLEIEILFNKIHRVKLKFCRIIPKLLSKLQGRERARIDSPHNGSGASRNFSNSALRRALCVLQRISKSGRVFFRHPYPVRNLDFEEIWTLKLLVIQFRI